MGVGSQRAPAPQYEPIVTEGNEALVHHMEVFQCAAEFESVPHFSGPCDSKMKPQRLNYCRHVLAAWALGAKVRAPPMSPGGAPSLLESHGSLEPQMPPPAPVPSLVGIMLAPRQVPLDLEGTVHRVVLGLPWLHPGSSRNFLQQLSGGLGRWACLGFRARTP